MIVYADNVEGLTPSQVTGFFVGWPNPPAPETHLRLFQQSDEIVLAFDDSTG